MEYECWRSPAKRYDAIIGYRKNLWDSIKIIGSFIFFAQLRNGTSLQLLAPIIRFVKTKEESRHQNFLSRENNKKLNVDY